MHRYDAVGGCAFCLAPLYIYIYKAYIAKNIIWLTISYNTKNIAVYTGWSTNHLANFRPSAKLIHSFIHLHTIECTHFSLNSR